MKSKPNSAFAHLKLHQTLSQNLQRNKFITMTPIQAYTIPQIIIKCNVLGLAKVGSGKTLAFLVPIIQYLMEVNWGVQDGLGALIVVPTRELGIQIFQVLNQIAQNIRLSCGMVCGGHKFEEEQAIIGQMNILVATPGRLCQHLEQGRSIGQNLQFLIFDEVDDLLEQGFIKQIKQIFDYFPQPYLQDNKLSRATAFFSATHSDRVDSLIRACFRSKQLKFIDLNIDTAQYEQNKQAEQHEYEPPQLDHPLTTVVKIQISCSLSNLTTIISTVHPADKLDVLFSFMRSFQYVKVIVFFATCSEVQFVFDAFRKLSVGTHLVKLNSKMSQTLRQEAFFEFKREKQGYLLTTDVAGRGIDVQDVQFVIQYDCPNNISDFIHRAGRCTRMNRNGLNILFLAKSEEKFKEYIDKKQIKYEEKFMKLKHAVSVKGALGVQLSQDVSLRKEAERAVLSYAKSVYVAQDKEVFKYSEYDLSMISRAHGLEVEVVQNDQQNEDQQGMEGDLLVVKEGTKKQYEEPKMPKKQYKLTQEQTISKMNERVNLLQMKIGKDDQADRKEHNKNIKRMREGVSEGDESEGSENNETMDDQELGEEYGEEEEVGEEEVQWEEPGKQ